MVEMPDEFEQQVAEDVIRLNFREDGARRVVTRGAARITYKYPSLKTGRTLEADSFNEVCVLRTLDVDPQVESFRTQPARIDFVVGQTTYQIFPDVLVRRLGNECFLNVAGNRTDWTRPAYFFADYLRTNLKWRGYGYEVATHEQIFSGPKLHNANLLLRYGRRPISRDDREHARRLFVKRSVITWHDVITGRLGHGATFTVARLMIEGRITYRPDQQIESTTVLNWNGHAPRPNTIP
jgi:hypothetical protein